MSYLQNAAGYDSMSLEDVASLFDIMKKENEVKKHLDTSKIKKRKDQEIFYIYVGKKQFASRSRNELISKLYDYFYGERSWTLAQAYENWFEWRIKIQTNTKTLRENKNEWNSYIAGTDLAKKKVVEITTDDLEIFYYTITANHSISKKRFTNINVVLNGIFKRCVALKIIPHSPIGDIDLDVFRKRCKPSKSTKTNYTVEERQKLLDYLSTIDEMYSYAIQLDFYLTCRIGELLALKREDVDGDYIYINRTLRQNYNIDENLHFTLGETSNEERLKGNEESGFRAIFLTPTAKAIIKKVIAMNPDGEFLFMKYDRQLNPNTFNEYLQRYCQKADVPYRSSHQIRFTMATVLYKNGVDLTEVSKMLGHADTATTWHYIRQNKPSDATNAKMSAIFG